MIILMGLYFIPIKYFVKKNKKRKTKLSFITGSRLVRKGIFQDITQ